MEGGFREFQGDFEQKDGEKNKQRLYDFSGSRKL